MLNLGMVRTLGVSILSLLAYASKWVVGESQHPCLGKTGRWLFSIIESQTPNRKHSRQGAGSIEGKSLAGRANAALVLRTLNASPVEKLVMPAACAATVAVATTLYQVW